jgi:nitroreductase
MELDKVIRGRRSIRSYSNREIADSVIEELIDLALHAPSSMDGQPWHFILVRDGRIKDDLVKIKNTCCPPEKQAYRADFLKKAPVVIVLCVDRSKSYDRGVENAVLAASNIMLGAYDRGLGSVYMSAYKTGDASLSEEIRKILNIPLEVDPVSIIPLGYPDETPQKKTVKYVKEVISRESFTSR